MKIPDDKILCLAHTDKRSVYCDRLTTCVRHQVISQFAQDCSLHVKSRVCALGTHDAFIDRDAFDSEGGAA